MVPRIGPNSDPGMIKQSRRFSLLPATVCALEGVCIARILHPFLSSSTRLELGLYQRKAPSR